MLSNTTRATHLHLVRHGHVQNPDKILYGRLSGFDLDARGVAEARRAARHFAHIPIAALYSSPLLRATRTAQVLLAEHSHLEITTSPLLNEVFSAYEGRSADEVAARNDDIYSGSAPEYEQPPDIAERAKAFVAHTLQQHAGKHVLAVTHGDVITFLFLKEKGLPLTPANKVNLSAYGLSDNYPATGSIVTFCYHGHLPGEQPDIAYCRPG